MNYPRMFNAALGIADLSTAWQQAPPSAYLFAAILAVGLVVLIWVVFVRKGKKRRKRIRRAHNWEGEPRRSRDRHGRRHSKRAEQRMESPMNPTLADVGGLPPVRPVEPSDSSEPDARQ